MTDVGDLDVDAVWLSGSTWRGQQTVLHTDTDCPHLDGTDPRGPLDPVVFHADTHVCKRCDPTAPDRYGGSTGTSLAKQLRYGHLDGDGAGGCAGAGATGGDE
jgi:hypothetical protein